MKKQCKECPWSLKNHNNNVIVEFSKKNNLSHNCHMSHNGGRNLWKVKDGTKCSGRKNYENLTNTA